MKKILLHIFMCCLFWSSAHAQDIKMEHKKFKNNLVELKDFGDETKTNQKRQVRFQRLQSSNVNSIEKNQGVKAPGANNSHTIEGNKIDLRSTHIQLDSNKSIEIPAQFNGVRSNPN